MKHYNWILVVAVSALALFVSGDAFAQAAADAAVDNSWKGMVGVGAGIAAGVAVIGGGIGQGLTGKAACEGVARNPQASGKILTQAIVALAMTESLVILSWLIALFMQGKI